MTDWSRRKGAEDWWQTAFIQMEGLVRLNLLETGSAIL